MSVSRSFTRLLVALTLILLFCSNQHAYSQAAPAAAAALPPGEKEPLLRLEAGGPTSFVTALSFSGDGQTLYASGFDKVVRAWNYDAKSKRFVLDPAATYRIPIGPGTQGSINDLAISPDGTVLAVAGQSIFRGNAGFRQPGLILPIIGGLSRAMRRDTGTIYLFDTRTRAVRLLRGHEGPVFGLAFAPARKGKGNILVSAAQDWDDGKNQSDGVVRVWDVEKASELAVLRKLPGNALKPGLDVWHTGDKPTEVRVAVAWGEGHLYLWDVEAEEIKQTDDGVMNTSAVYRLDGGQLLTASVRPNVGGHLQVWNVPSGQSPQPVSGEATTFPTSGDGVEQYQPRTLKLLSSKPGAALDLAAVVIRIPGKSFTYRLRLLDLRPEHFGAIRADVEVWNGSQNRPSLATVAGGRYLAVAGNGSHFIRLFRIADLLNKVKDPDDPFNQPLTSVGDNFRSVAFARKGEDVALVLAPEAKTQRGDQPKLIGGNDLLFDFTRRQLTDKHEGWKLDVASTGAWKTNLAVPKNETRESYVLTVTRPDGEERAFQFPANQRITDYALLPAMKPFNVPLLAVALYKPDIGEVLLHLYNAETREKIRQFTGHVEPIRCVVFAANGRLLASAADDQTVSVWTLTSLNQILGQRGLLTGVAVKDVKGKVEVGQVSTSSPAAGKLAAGDVIEGLLEKNKLVPFASPREFYDAMSVIKPGAPATLRVAGKGDIVLKIGQAIDERKPLLSLFVTKGLTLAQREWVGWNPVGPYESSDRKAERHIGWHFNTGKADAPTAFALADQYRKEYYREGILRLLIVEAGLTPALKAWEDAEKAKKLPPPKMTMYLDEIGPDPKALDGKGQVLLAGRKATLKLAIDDFPLDRIEAVAWQIDDGNLQPFAVAEGRERTADLSPLLTKRGIYKVRVALRTQEGDPQEYTRELVVRFQPPPGLRYTAAWLKRHFPEGEGTRLVVRAQPSLTIEAEAEPALPDEALTVTLKTGAEPVKVAARVNHEVKLQPGDTLIELEARPTAGLAGYETADVVRKTLFVTYVAPAVKMPPPRIDLEQIEGIDRAAPHRLIPGQAVVVTAPSVFLRGRILAEEALARANRDEQALTGFEADKIKDLSLRETIRLVPGRQTVTISARTKTSDPATAAVVIEYRPALPKVLLAAPTSGLHLLEGKDPRELGVQGRFIAAADPRPFKALLVLNDVELPDALKIDELNGTIKGTFRLEPGSNRLQVRLTNEWKQSETTPEVQVRYVRPPREIQFAKVGVLAKPFATLDATVRSSLPLLAKSIEAEVNGRPVLTAEVVRPEGENEANWRVRLKDVPLDPGTNLVKLWVSNAEGRSAEPGATVVTYQAPAEIASRPQVEILEPNTDANVTDPSIPVRFRVKSTTPLRRLELIREDGTPVRQVFAVADLKRNQQGYYEASGVLPLLPRANRIRVEAVNEGGEDQAGVVLNYLRLPVRLDVETLQAGGADEPTVKPTVMPDGKLAFPPSAEGRVTLRGRVKWTAENDEQLRAVKQVRVYVNGFQQVPADLKPAVGNSRDREFEADVLLTKATGNRVQIELPGLQQDASNRKEFQLDCKAPQRGQRLHLLLVSVGEKDAAKLTDRALRSFQANAGKDGKVSTPVFEQVRTYGPLTDFVSPEEVFTQLCLIKKTIDLRSSDGSAKDVIMVYYQGNQAKKPDGTFFQTSVSEFDPDLKRSGITTTGLQTFFNETLGAKVLLLDVADDQAAKADPTVKDQIAKWPDSTYAGVLRYERHGLDTVPEDATLLANFGRALKAGGTLLDATEQLDEDFPDGTSRKYSRNLSYNKSVPTNLSDLKLTAKP